MQPLFAGLEKVRNSPLLRLLLIGFLALLLLLPIAKVESLVDERINNRETVEAEIAAKWGGAQNVVGPVIVVPYVRRSLVTDDHNEREVLTTHYARILPESVTFTSTVKSEVRQRGLYEVPLFRARTEVSGSFARPELTLWGIRADDIYWSRAQLVVELLEPRSLQQQVSLQFGQVLLSFEPSTGDYLAQSGIHAPVEFLPGTTAFSFALDQAGSRSLRFAPVGRSTQAEVKSDWRHPSFQGDWLPTQRQLGPEGFSAQWAVPHLGRNYAQLSNNEGRAFQPLSQSTFGVDLFSPVDTYSMSRRSVKYAGLLVLLTFALVWVLEVLGSVRLHSIQYLLTGAGVCLFFLLQLSLAEQLGALAAHTIASVMATLLVASYSWVTLKSLKRACLVGGLLGFLFSYLYVLFGLENYALLIGSLSVFAALGSVMYVTRRVVW